MSMTLSNTTTTAARIADLEANRLRWAAALAHYTSTRREELGLTIAAAAELAGLQISEWIGLEDGWVLEDLATLRAIAGALRVRWMDYHTLAFLAGVHQKCC